jgi:hypothetical protein
MENKKMLVFLNSSNKWHRILRRGVVVAFLTFVSIALQGFIIDTNGTMVPEYMIPVFTAILVMLDKMIREESEKNE